MGPERILPNQSEDLGEPQDPPIEWSGGEEEEDEEVQSGYQYQPLNQDPEDGAQTESDLQERLQAMRLHLPDPPVDSEDEDEDPAAQSSIPMDAGVCTTYKSVDTVIDPAQALFYPSSSIPWSHKDFLLTTSF
ncbi:male-enhanced antigen 1-like [Anomaloglossus baeobatrachus]|uniref:male-enhanced antigen 1-like n=1 Tax=Anomaloglossus baeobatrachus TaxID=238106 RepID=UPI003F509161